MSRNSPVRNTEEAPPRTRRNAPSQKRGGGGGRAFGFVLFGLLVIGGGIFALIHFLGKTSTPNIDHEMISYLPDGTNVMMGTEVETLLKHDSTKNLLNHIVQVSDVKNLFQDLKKAGIDQGDIVRILFGGRFKARVKATDARPTGNLDVEAFSYVVRTKKPLDKSKVISSLNLKETSKNGKTCYQYPQGGDLFIYLPTDSLLVVAFNKAIEEVTGRESGKSPLSDDMRELSKEMSKGELWVAIGKSMIHEENLKGYGKFDQIWRSFFSIIAPYTHAKFPDSPGLEDFVTTPKELVNAASGMRGMGAYLHLDGDRLEFNISIQCADGTTASEAASALQKEFSNLRVKNLKDDQPYDKKLQQLHIDFIKAALDLQKTAHADSNGTMLGISANFALTELKVVYGVILPEPLKDPFGNAPKMPELKPLPPPTGGKDFPKLPKFPPIKMPEPQD